MLFRNSLLKSFVVIAAGSEWYRSIYKDDPYPRFWSIFRELTDGVANFTWKLGVVLPLSWPIRMNHELGSYGPGKLTEKGKFPKVLRGGCKRSFGPREQRSPKSLLHHPKLLLHRCKMGFGWCKRLFGDLCSLGPKDLLHPRLSTFGNFPFSVNFPGP